MCWHCCGTFCSRMSIPWEWLEQYPQVNRKLPSSGSMTAEFFEDLFGFWITLEIDNPVKI